jgi:hypothetical protein
MNICAKLEHFKKSQGNLEFHQNKCHPRDVPNMKRQRENATDQWDQGVAAGWPNPMVGRPTFVSVWPKASWTRIYTRRGRIWRWRKFVKVELIGPLATWLGRPATTWRVTTMAKSVELPHSPITLPSTSES